MQVYDASGNELRATFSIDNDDGTIALTFESRGPDRNQDYNAALEILLGRLAALDASISEAAIVSRDTADLPSEQRTVEVDGYSYPIVLQRLPDLLAFRRALGAAQARTGRQPDARGGGNTTKRIRLSLTMASDRRIGLSELAAHLRGQSSERRYWALCANPAKYRVADAVRDLDCDLWTTTHRDMHVGDRVLIWQAQGAGARRGIVAFGEIAEPARVCADFENPYWIDRNERDGEVERIAIRYIKPAGLPLWLGAPGAEFLDELSVARARGGSVFHVTPKQWEAVVRSAQGWREPSADANQVEEQVRTATRGRSQGRASDATLRRIVEDYAMRRAVAYFESRWPEVHDVSRRASFDLLCRDGARCVRVEVKGTTGKGDAILVTANEIATLVECTLKSCFL